MWISEITL
jgi:hypothetical protein